MKIKPILLSFLILILFVALSDNRAHTQKVAPPRSNKKTHIVVGDSVSAKLDSMALYRARIFEVIADIERTTKGAEMQQKTLTRQSSNLDKAILKKEYENRLNTGVDLILNELPVNINAVNVVEAIPPPVKKRKK